jgi:catechol-2,3-dioxygenase
MDTVGSVESRHSQAVDTARDLDGPVLELDHIAIAVADLPEAITWYTQKLGFRVVERRTTADRIGSEELHQPRSA